MYGCNAVVEMHDALMACAPGTAWVVATGTLTNIGLLFSTFPETAKHIKGLSIMGGAIGDHFTKAPIGSPVVDSKGNSTPRIGNVTAHAEFNIWCDPEAARSIFSNPELQEKTVLIPLDVTHLAFANSRVQDLLWHGKPSEQSPNPSDLRQMYHELLMYFAHTYARVFGMADGPPLHDPVAVAVLLKDHPNPEHRIDFQTNDEAWTVDIELAGREIGRTRIKAINGGVLIPRTFDLDKFWSVLNDCMLRAELVCPLA